MLAGMEAGWMQSIDKLEQLVTASGDGSQLRPASM
jgi:hypothetical protein